MLQNIFEEFQNPSSKYRGKPFWAWNGKLEREELLRQIGVMQKMGFGGFTMHSRTGLATEYLGEEWFQLVDDCAEEADRLGMEAWLYDEDRWPSGSAGGLVTSEEKYRMKYVMLDVTAAEQFVWKDGILAAFEAELDGLHIKSYEAITEGNAPRSGSTVLVFRVEFMRASSFFNGNSYLDTMMKEATEKFIEVTHEQYKQKMGDRFGKSIQAIFTDEPYRGEVMSNVCRDNSNPEWGMPWTEDLFNQFRERFHYDVKARLPELFLLYGDSNISEVKWHYMELIQQLFLENFAKPLHDWCQTNQLLLTGHVWHEDSLTAQTIPCGSVMRYYEYMDIPGVDVLTENNRNYWIVKQLASAARQLGKPWMLSEIYGCSGWQMSFENHKNTGDWQALFGINVRSHHLSWYTMQGEAKRDYPGSILHQSAWWEDYSHVEDYFSRIGVAMSQGSSCCDTLVINPVESVWCQVYPGWTRDFKPLSPEIIQLENQYENLFHWLSGANIDFDYGDEEMLGRLGSIGHTEAGLPYLQLGEARYMQVIIAGMTTIRSTTVRKLAEFLELGGKVIFAGETPTHVDARKSEQALQLSEKGERIGFQQEQVVKASQRGIRQRVELRDPQTGEEITDIYVQVKEQGDVRFILAVNMNQEQMYNNVQVTVFDGGGFVQEWNSSEGSRVAVASGEERCEFHADFYPGGEHLYVVTREQDRTLAEQQVYAVKQEIPVIDGYDYVLNEPNILVLDRVSYQVEGEWKPETEVLKADREIRQQLSLPLRGGEMVQPWFRERMEDDGSGVKETKGLIELIYQFNIEEMPQENLALVMESPESFKTKVNGTELNTKNTQTWIDICFKRIHLPRELLRKGENRISLITDFHDGIDLEAIYILGSFGVSVEGTRCTLTRLPERLTVGDLVKQGLPFYSGKVTYLIEELPEAGLQEIQKDERCFLKVGGYGGACIKVNPHSPSPKMIAWQPYEADITDEVQVGEPLRVELTLTRRNTFGPLHHAPLYTDWYGPDQFITEGASYAEDYALIPTGLLESPVIVIKQRL